MLHLWNSLFSFDYVHYFRVIQPLIATYSLTAQDLVSCAPWEESSAR